MAEVSATVMAPAAFTAKAPFAFPEEIVNPATVAESPVEARFPTAESSAAFSAMVKDAAVMSIAWLVMDTETVSESAFEPSVARMFKV